MRKGSILVVDDEAEIREGLEALLSSEGFDVTPADTGAAGLARLEDQPFDLLLLDVSLPDRNGLDLLREIRRRDPYLSIILITAFGSIDMARQAFKSGAQDYITKPWSNDELIAQVSLAIEGRRLREENVQLKRAFKQRYNFPSIIGKSEKMLSVLDLVTQVAPSRSTVLINGESGTGKELIAKAIHSASTRADKPFIPINTGSIPVDLLESQLFGHVRGAFTSAVASKKGLFEVADQGTIFFDEISTISPETQAKLLRVIQEREFMRLGGTDTIKVDVRILAASNEDLTTLVREGRFREDLFHRLNVISLRLPPLRDRKEDIPLLVEKFLERYRTGIVPMLIEPAWANVDDPIERIFALLARYRMLLEMSHCAYGCPIGSLALELHEPDPAVRQLLANNFSGWIDQVENCLVDARSVLGRDLDTRRTASFVLTVMEGAVMQARTYRDLRPFDAAIATLRDHFNMLQRAATRTELA